MLGRLPRATCAALLCAGSLLTVTAGRAAAAPPLDSAPATATASARDTVQAPAALPDGAQVTGDVADATPLQVTVALTPRDPAGLDAFVGAVATPGSPDFRHYLSVAQFAERFGADDGDVAAVRAALAAAGLQTGAVSANGLSLPVSGTAAQLEDAFHTTLAQVRLAGGGSAYADTTAPSLPAAAAAGVSAVVGLDSLPLASPEGLRRVARPRAQSQQSQPAGTGITGGPQTCPTAVGHGTTAPQIGAAYGMDGLWAAGDLGAGQTVAVYELEPFSASDVAAYQSCYGTSATVQVKTIGTGPGTGPGTGEAALDIEDIAGLVPRATIVVYQAKNGTRAAFGAYQQIVADDTATVISTSWGLCESQAGSAAINAEATLFAEAAAQGQTIFAASGDHGADDCRNGSGRAVDDPASQPDVTGVGGTTLPSYLTPASETVWNHSTGATGGGLSAVNVRPDYQPAAVAGSHRAVPDVSADADPSTGYPVYLKGAWTTFGGTSAAAPTWAALLALANGSSYCGTPVGFANPVLYSLPDSDFYDVTSGNNTFNGVAGFAAGAGDDIVSGLGAPNGASLVPALCGAQPGTVVPPPTTTTSTTPTTTTPAPVVTPPAPTTTQPAAPVTTTTTVATAPARPSQGTAVVFHAPGRMRARVGRAVLVKLHASSRAGRSLHFSAIGLPAGLRIARGTGTVRGIPRRAGRFTTTVRAIDTAGNAVSVVIRWRVAGR